MRRDVWRYDYVDDKGFTEDQRRIEVSVVNAHNPDPAYVRVSMQIIDATDEDVDEEDIYALRIEDAREGGRVKINVRKDLVTMQKDLSPEESLKLAIAIATHAKKTQGEEEK